MNQALEQKWKTNPVEAVAVGIATVLSEGMAAPPVGGTTGSRSMAIGGGSGVPPSAMGGTEESSLILPLKLPELDPLDPSSKLPPQAKLPQLPELTGPQKAYERLREAGYELNAFNPENTQVTLKVSGKNITGIRTPVGDVFDPIRGEWYANENEWRQALDPNYSDLPTTWRPPGK